MSLAISDPHALLVELARHNFIAFLIRAFPHLNGGADLSPNWHLDAIAHQLDRVRKGRCKRLLVTMPPRNLKSITISVAWVAWCLGHDPSLNFVCVSYSNELSAKHARDCRALMQSPWYRELFPRTILTASRLAVHDFETTAGGGRLATSIGGTLTGRGGDIIIIDDPIKPDEALSEVSRAAVNDWFQSTLASRLNDKRRGAIITVMQRLHEYDLAGMLIESGEWDQLSLPAIATEDSVVTLTRGKQHRRKTGDVLHPARESYAELMAIKRAQGSINFAAQYQQQPVPAEGNMIKAEWLRTYAGDFVPEPPGLVVQSWDTASKDGVQNDWSVCVTAHVRRNEIRIIDVFRAKLTFPDLKRNAIRLAREYRASAILIEDQASGTQLLQTLRNEQPTGVTMPIPCKPEGDKRSRMAGVSGQIEGGQLLLPIDAPWLAAFKSELLGFPNVRNDDQADALTQLMNWALRSADRFGLACIGSPILFTMHDDGSIEQYGGEEDGIFFDRYESGSGDDEFGAGWL